MLGRNKMYKKGLADAMHGYENFGKKQEAALEKIRQDVKSGNKKLETALAEMGENIFAIFDLLDKKEKEALYHLHTPIDIKDLEESEKRLLLAILFQLAEDEGDTRYNDYQRKFILSVKKYLEITNPQIEAEYSSIENIDSIDVQKVFMRVILEFLYLQDEEEITDWQEEVFDYFSVNKRHAKIIECDVIRRYHILGAEGMAENYGFVFNAVPVGSDDYLNNMEDEYEISLDLADRIKRSIYAVLKDYVVFRKDTGFISINKYTNEEKYHELNSGNYYIQSAANNIFYEENNDLITYDFDSEERKVIYPKINSQKYMVNSKYVLLKTRPYNYLKLVEWSTGKIISLHQGNYSSRELYNANRSAYSSEKYINVLPLLLGARLNHKKRKVEDDTVLTLGGGLSVTGCCIDEESIYFIADPKDYKNFAFADKLSTDYDMMFIGKCNLDNFDVDFIGNIEMSQLDFWNMRIYDNVLYWSKHNYDTGCELFMIDLNEPSDYSIKSISKGVTVDSRVYMKKYWPLIGYSMDNRTKALQIYDLKERKILNPKVELQTLSTWHSKNIVGDYVYCENALKKDKFGRNRIDGCDDWKELQSMY